MHKKLLILFITIIILPISAVAEWMPQKTILEGVWGKDIGQFGIFHGDSFDSFPMKYLVDNKDNIIIQDHVNRRIQIFNDGKYTVIMPDFLPVGFEKEDWPYDGTLAIVDETVIETRNGHIYNFQGNFVGNFSVREKYFIGQDKEGNLYFKDLTNKFQKYAPTGELLSSYDQRPLELGVVISKIYRNGGGEYVIKYEDITFNISSSDTLESASFVRDQKGYLYGYAIVQIMQESDQLHSRAFRFDRCGKAVGAFNLPEDNVEELDVGGDTAFGEIRYIYHAQYGTPVIGPDGSVYAWKRTPTTYSILKWTWVDSPDDPKGGPDAPLDLKVAPSTDGLFLTWTASPQDPGCVEGYEVERSSTSGGIFSNLTTTAAGVVKYNDTGAFAGSTYYYRIRAKSSCGPSPYTAEISGKRP